MDGLRVWVGHNGIVYVFGSMPNLFISARCWLVWHFG